MANYKKVAEQILSTVGGAENVASVTHCMTRLRFNLKDESLSNDEKLEDISSIISVVHAGGQVQLVVGPTVDKVYDEVCKQGGFEVTVSIDEELDGPQLSWKERLAPKHLFNQLLDAVSGAITPILPIFCVAGIFKMLVILFGPEGAGFMSETSDLYRILSLVGDAAYYYFPVFAAYSSAKKFKTSPVLALLIAVVMIYPDMLAIVEDGKPFSVFGIPMQLVNYTQAVLPVILITWAQSYVERFFKKISPDMLRILIVPVGTVLVMLSPMSTATTLRGLRYGVSIGMARSFPVEARSHQKKASHICLLRNLTQVTPSLLPGSTFRHIRHPTTSLIPSATGLTLRVIQLALPPTPASCRIMPSMRSRTVAFSRSKATTM